MKPKLLKPGAKVKCDGRELVFVRREKADCQPPLNVLRCEDYRGLNGPKDTGLCTMTDNYLARHCAAATSEHSCINQPQDNQ